MITTGGVAQVLPRPVAEESKELKKLVLDALAESRQLIDVLLARSKRSSDGHVCGGAQALHQSRRRDLRVRARVLGRREPAVEGAPARRAQQSRANRSPSSPSRSGSPSRCSSRRRPRCPRTPRSSAGRASRRARSARASRRGDGPVRHDALVRRPAARAGVDVPARARERHRLRRVLPRRAAPPAAAARAPLARRRAQRGRDRVVSASALADPKGLARAALGVALLVVGCALTAAQLVAEECLLKHAGAAASRRRSCCSGVGAAASRSRSRSASARRARRRHRPARLLREHGRHPPRPAREPGGARDERRVPRLPRRVQHGRDPPPFELEA